ncbi:nickel pincer cofactor biosynthesis protein LarB [Methanococcus maripaludis]|uniref:PurE domain-containing protein n=2 Tax=Methanococcus maripaludis TaxID=39152 RepID=A0A7J9PGT7_METMI|nr:nickel pincer cofactor biosynthesis protein LarB [Methanococcus maripaludis]MBA2862004.1 hypothetical protein [Methanococcus maripaludis]
MKDILEKFKTGNLSLEEAEKKLKLNYFDELGGFCKLDTNRKLRTGIPEVIYAEGKRCEDVAKILKELAFKNNIALATRVNDTEELKKYFKDETDLILEINELGRTAVLKKQGFEVEKTEKIGILAAGTSDIPIAEEAAESAKIMGCEVIKNYDVGIAGIHRLFTPVKNMIEEDVCCIIAVAGMEGALPSVISSLVDIPVIGVPTSVGYGYKLTPLLTMLHSCSPGLVVVNIDNGFGAGVFAGLIASNISKRIKRG